MTNDLIVVVSAGGAVLGAAVSGFATYKAALIGFKRKQSQNQLLRALEDLQSFIEIEKYHLDQLVAISGKNFETLKRECRASVREKLGRGLSSGTEPTRLQKTIESLAKEA